MTDADKPAFKDAMAALCIALREKDPDAPQMRAYFKALEDLEIEFVAAAVPILFKRCQFFPKPSEWLEAAQQIERDRHDELKLRRQARMKAGLPPLCSACGDTGFERNEAKNGVVPCDCRKLRRLEVLGRRPMPALPPGPEAA